MDIWASPDANATRKIMNIYTFFDFGLVIYGLSGEDLVNCERSEIGTNINKQKSIWQSGHSFYMTYS